MTVSKKQIEKLRKESLNKEVCLRSCWKCNPAHEHLKEADYLICCLECGGYFYKGVEITA